MGVKIKKTYMVVDSNGYFINPQRLRIAKKEILKYVENNPMPEDPAYSSEDLVFDLAEHYQEYWVLPNNIKEETIRYIEILIDKLRNDNR